MNTFRLLVLLFVSAQLLSAAPGNYLNYAILTLPPKYLADIPMEQRGDLLRELSFLPGDARLDYANGYLNFYSDSPEPPNASSMFFMKIFPTDSPFDPFVFVHMQKPYNGEKPSRNDTFVLERSSKGWDDITDAVFPKGIDRKSHFRPLRGTTDIEVAPWTRKGNWGGYNYGTCKMLLRWNGKTFDRITIEPRKISRDEPEQDAAANP